MSRDHWEVEKYHEHEIYVDGNGVFFAKDDDGKRQYEAKSIAAVRAKLRESTPVNIPAMSMSYWNQDRESLVTVYAISGLGNLLYTDEHGNKHKATKRETLYVRDDARLKTLHAMRANAEQLRKDIQKLIETWPKVTVPK